MLNNPGELWGHTNDDKLAQDAAEALADIRIERVHYTYSLHDFETFHEDYRYVFRNTSARPHRILPLLWREREVQANMFVFGADGTNLIYLPSSGGVSAARRYFRAIWLDFSAKSNLPHAERIGEELSAIFAFDVSEATKDNCETILNEVQDLVGDDPSFRSIRRLIRFYGDFYIPWVELSSPVGPGESVFIHHGVDIYQVPSTRPVTRASASPRLTRAERLFSYLFGGFELETPIPIDPFEFPPWSETNSFHVRIRVPQGLRICGAASVIPSRLFDGTRVAEFSSFDANNAYFYFGKSEIAVLLANRAEIDREYEEVLRTLDEQVKKVQVQTLPEGSGPDLLRKLLEYFYGALREAIQQVHEQARTPHITVRLRPARGIRALLTLLWITTLLALVGILGKFFSFDQYVQFLAAYLVIVLSVVVFSINKEFLKEIVPFHVALTAPLILAVPLIWFLWPFLSRLLPLQLAY